MCKYFCGQVLILVLIFILITFTISNAVTIIDVKLVEDHWTGGDEWSAHWKIEFNSNPLIKPERVKYFFDGGVYSYSVDDFFVEQNVGSIYQHIDGYYGIYYPVWFKIKVNGVWSNKYSIGVYFENKDVHHVAPYYPTLSIDTNGEHPVISWTQPNGGGTYKIYRKVAGVQPYYRYRVSTTNNNYTDTGVYLPDPIMNISYKVIALPNSNKESLPKSIVSCQGDALSKRLISLKTGSKRNNDYYLLQNYPNPFNLSTHIRFSIPDESHINLIIYNEFGQIVAKLTDKTYSPGTYEIYFNGENLPSGYYFYKLTTFPIHNSKNIKIFKKQMLLIK